MGMKNGRRPLTYRPGKPPEESIGYGRIEEPTAPVFEPEAGRFPAQRLAITTPGRQRIEIVGNRGHPGAEGDLLSGKAERIPRPVPPFVMAGCNPGHPGQGLRPVDPVEYLPGFFGVSFDGFELLSGQHPFFSNDSIRHGGLSDVVKEGCHREDR
jgi:hypothetical protein